MKKRFLFFALILSMSLVSVSALAAPSIDAAYQYAYNLFSVKNYAQAKRYYLYVFLNASTPEIKANSLYLLCQCYLRLGDYNNCVKAANMLAAGYPNSDIVKKGMLTQFSADLISQITDIQTDWDYWRYPDGTDDQGQIIWKESVPVGKRIKRMDFKLAFGLYQALDKLNPGSTQVAVAKNELDTMLDRPLTIVWVDAKAAPNHLGHPADFFSLFTKKEKKAFSKVICERMFYDWQSDKLYRFMDMYDDVRNLKPRYTAKTFNLDGDDSDSSPQPISAAPSVAPPPPPPLPGVPEVPAASVAPIQPPTSEYPTLTLGKLFAASAYDPYTNTFSNPAAISGAVAPSFNLP